MSDPRIDPRVGRVHGNSPRDPDPTTDQSRGALQLVQKYCTVQTKKKKRMYLKGLRGTKRKVSLTLWIVRSRLLFVGNSYKRIWKYKSKDPPNVNHVATSNHNYHVH